MKRNWEVTVAERSFRRNVSLAKRYAALYKKVLPPGQSFEISEDFRIPYVYRKGGFRWPSVGIEDFVKVCRVPPEKLVLFLSGNPIVEFIARERLKCP